MSAFEQLDVDPIGRTTAKKQGGTLRTSVIADAAREVGIEPSDLSHDDEVEFLISKSTEHDDRLVLDVVSKP